MDEKIKKMKRKITKKKKSPKFTPLIINEEYLTNSIWELHFLERHWYDNPIIILLNYEGIIWIINKKYSTEKNVVKAVGEWKFIERTLYFDFNSSLFEFDCNVKEGNLKADGALIQPFNIPCTFSAEMNGQSSLILNSKIRISRQDLRYYKWRIIDCPEFILSRCELDTYDIYSLKIKDNVTNKEYGTGKWSIMDNKQKLSMEFKLGSFKGVPSENSTSVYFNNKLGIPWGFSADLKKQHKRVTSLKKEIDAGSYYENFVSEYNDYNDYDDIINLLYKEPFYLFIDIETNGLPDYFPEPKTNPEVYPEIIQIATLCCDSYGKRIRQADKYIIPKGWEIKEDVKRLLNIDNNGLENMQRNGMYIINPIELKDEDFYFVDPDVSIGEYLGCLFGIMENHFGFIVGHNIEYDINCLEALYYRCLKKEEYKEFTSRFRRIFIQNLPQWERICTMKGTSKYCGIESRRGYKYPKLEELYEKLFQEDMENAHNASSDVYNTAKCYWKLRDLGMMEIDGEISETDTHPETENPEIVKIVSLTLTGDNEGYVHYGKYRGDTLISNGIAFCEDVDAVEIDEDNNLTCNSRLSQDGLTIFSL